jgi:HK97 family phage portal protein
MLRRLMSAAKAPAAKYPPFALQQAEREQWTLPPLTLPQAQAELYQRLSWVQIAVGIIARSAATAGVQVRQLSGEDAEQVVNHPFELLLQHPNPLMSRFRLLEATFADRKLTGNAYWWLNKPSQFAPPDELWLIPPYQIKPIPDGKLYLAGYEYDSGQGLPLILPVEAVCHFRTYNPLSQFVGLSAIEALATVATGDMAMQKWNTNFFAKDHAKIPGAIAFANMIPDPQWLKIQDEFKRQHGGTERNQLLLRGTGDGAVSWLPMAAIQKDIEFLAGRQASKEEIFQVLGVPPGMMDKNATEANATAAKAVFSELTLWPELVSVAETITNAILPLYGANLVLAFDDPRKTDRALELSEQAEYSRTHTIDEVRAKFYEDAPIGDERGNLLIVEVPPALVPFAGVNQPPEQPEDTAAPEPEPPAANAEADAEQGVKPEPAAKALLDDLHAWRRKCKTAGKLTGFASDAIPFHLTHAVKTLGADDWQRGFAWVPLYAALKARRQPDRVYEDKLRKQIAAILKRQLDDATQAIAAGESVDYTAMAAEVKRAILPSLTNAALDEAIAQAGTVGLTFDIAVVNAAALEWAAKYSYELIKDISATTQKLVSHGVSAFIETPGMTVGELRSMLEAGFSETRASMIATTEVTRAYTQGTQIAQAELAEAGIRMQRIWNTSGDEVVCQICEPLNGKPESEWGGDELPGHVNCILPGNEVGIPGALAAAAKSFYRGRAVELTLDSGRRLTVTQNHPILTAYGWRAAQLLHEGDDVIICSAVQRIAQAINPDNHHVPTKIEQVYATLEMKSQVMSRAMPVTAEDFHGDGRGIDGNVQIVRANSFLRRDIQTMRAEAFGKTQFGGMRSDERNLVIDSPELLGVQSVMTSTAGAMGMVNHSCALFGSGFCPTDEHRVRDVAGFYPGFKQATAEGPTIDASLARQFAFRFASDITSAKVIQVRYFYVACHVYDLQVDPYELYTCNGVVVKNCRCWDTLELAE